MKILFFSYAFPNPVNPGVGTFNRTMIAGLAKDNDVRVVSPVSFVDAWQAWWHGRLPRGLNDATFQAVKNVPAEYCTWYYTPKFFRNLYGRFMSRSVRGVLNRAMRQFKPDIVLSYWTHPDGEVAVQIAHQFGIRAVTIVGGSDVLLNGRSGSRRIATLNVLRAADAVVTISEDLKKVLIADGICPSKLTVIRRGIDCRLFHPGNKSEARKKLGLLDDVPILISVGRLVDIKGHSHLIEACRLLVRSGVRFKCYLVGEGPLRSALEDQIAQQGLKSHVELMGSRLPVELADWYRAADLSVLPSVSEGVPNVLLESIACGTPFVASSVGGIPEIADLSLDSLFPASHPQALANAIAARLATVNKTPKLSRRFTPHTMDESAAQMSSVLRMIASGRTPLLSQTKLMHETMTAEDLATVHAIDKIDAEHGPNSCQTDETADHQLASNRPAEADASAVAFDGSATSDVTDLPANQDLQPEAMDAAFAEYLDLQLDDLDRTGEGFFYLANGAKPFTSSDR